MDIEISSPINITMDVIELDEHVPSLKFSITIRVKKFSYSSEINSQLWIECQCFDDFIDSMRKGETAVLKDMNDFFELRVNPVQNWLCSGHVLEKIWKGISHQRMARKSLLINQSTHCIKYLTIILNGGNKTKIPDLGVWDFCFICSYGFASFKIVVAIALDRKNLVLSL